VLCTKLEKITSTDDRKRLETFMRHSATLGYREDSTLTFDSICTKADEKLFSGITGKKPSSPPASSSFPQREQHYSSVITHTTSSFLYSHVHDFLIQGQTFTCALSQ